MTVPNVWNQRQRKLERELVHAAQRLLKHSNGTPALKVQMDEAEDRVILLGRRDSVKEYVMAWNALDSER